jgi:DNA-binding CsgD family transcriptional regulator
MHSIQMPKYRPGGYWPLAGAFALIFVLMAWDLSSDYSDGVDWLHVAIEAVVLIVSGSAVVILAARQIRQVRRLRSIRNDLAQARDESARWRTRYQHNVLGLARAIRAQFDEWGLSEAEAEVAMLLLKGLSLREVAAARGTGERTVRDQARAVYRKAGLPNRSALAAFFLEDLLLPIDRRA